MLGDICSAAELNCRIFSGRSPQRSGKFFFLEGVKKVFSKKFVTSAAAFAAFGLFSPGDLLAGHVIESATDEIKIQIYGQVNRAMMWVDDGADSHTRFVDNDHASTRFGLRGRVTIDGLTAGMRIEGAVNPNSSSAAGISQANTDGGNNSFATRHADVFLQSVKFGTISLGHGSRATDGIDESDLSLTKLVGYADPRKYAGGFFFSDGTDLLNVSVREVGLSLSGSRGNRIRYDSPSYAGFVLSASTSGGHDDGLALRYAKRYERLRVLAGIGYRNQGATEDVSGSASVLLTNGLSVSVAAGHRDFDAANRSDANFVYGKLGYQRSLLQVGPSAVAVDYGRYNDFSTKAGELEGFGFMAVQSLVRWGTDLYAGYRNYSIDVPGAKDINVVMTGMRVVF
jgi:hypothetical protein